MSKVDVRLAFVAISAVACAASEGRFPRSPRPPGVEVARIGEAKLTQLDAVSSQIGDNIESSFANSTATAPSQGEPTAVKNEEKTIVISGPIGPPRDLDPSVGRAPSIPLLANGNRNLQSAQVGIRKQRAEAFPSHSVWFSKEPLESRSGSSAARLGPARSFDVDFVNSEITSTGSSQISKSQTLSSAAPQTTAIAAFPLIHDRRSIAENDQPSADVTENEGVSNQQSHAANRESPSGDEAGSLLQFGEDNNRDTADNVDGRIDASRRRLLVDGDADISRKPDSASFAYENTDFYDTDIDRIISPSLRRPANRHHSMQNEWSDQPASYYGPPRPRPPWQPLP